MHSRNGTDRTRYASDDDATSDDQAADGPASLEQAVHAMFDAHLRLSSAVRADLGVSAVEHALLCSLLHADRAIGDATRHTGIGRSSISMAAKRLADRGFLTRLQHGGRTTLSLTGATRSQIAETTSLPIQMAITEWLTTRDQSRIELLQHLADGMDARRLQRAERSTSEQLQDALVRGDSDAGFNIARGYVTDGDPNVAYEALQGALARFTCEPSSAPDLVNTADSHIATATACTVVDRVRALTRHARSSGDVALVLASPSGHDEVVQLMLVGEAERMGWTTQRIGLGISTDDLALVCARMRAHVVVMHVPRASDVSMSVTLARSVLRGRAALVVVGAPLRQSATAAQFTELGARVAETVAHLPEALMQVARASAHRAA